MRKTVPSNNTKKGITPIVTSTKDNNINALDVPIVPSTSTFSLSGKEDKPEKYNKKVKNFFDERQKTKSRIQSLWSYIDTSNSFDQARFFQENAEQVFQVAYETCMSQIDKIKSKSERPQSWNSKELVSLQKTLILFRKIFLYIPELMRNGWQRQNISIVLSHILDHRNHPKLRALGFQLLLLWLNDQVVEYPECTNLFSNAISLELFVLDDIQNDTTTHTTIPPNPLSHDTEETVRTHTTGLHFIKKLKDHHHPTPQTLERDEKIKSSRIEVNQKLIVGDDSTAPLFPNPSQPTFQDSIVLIHIFINNLVRLSYVAACSPPPPDDYDYPSGDHIEPDDGIAVNVGIDAAAASAKFLFKMFRTYYMTKFVPLISKSLQVEGAPKTGVCGFPSCPPSILRTFLRFLIGYCLDNNSQQANTHWPHLVNTSATAPSSSPATPILKSIILSSHETREILHEILRQSLTLPCTHTPFRDIIRGAMHILGVWILSSEDERPSFLRRTNSVSRSISTVSNSTQDSASSSIVCTSPVTYEEPTDPNQFLRRYLLMIKLVFEEGQVKADWEGVVGVYKGAISVYRAIAVSKSGIELEWESWELLLQCLLDIQQWLMSQPEKYCRVPVQSLADELADYVWETLLHAFVRAKITHLELWQHLKIHIVSSMRWIQTLNQWVRIMQKLTRLLSSRLYRVEYDLYPDTKYRLIEEFPTSTTANQRHTRETVEKNAGGSTRLSRNGSNRSKSKPKHLGVPERQSHSTSDLLQSPELTPEASVSNILRNLSNASLTELAHSFKSDRKTAPISSILDGEEEDSNRHGGIKFSSLKKIPTTSSITQNSITGKRSNTAGSIASTTSNNNSSSITSSNDRSIGRRTLSIGQFDNLWQESGSKLLNFVQHGDISGSSVNLSHTIKVAGRDEEKKGMSDWENSGSSIEEVSTKSNQTASSHAWLQSESISIVGSLSSVNEKLPSGLGLFKSTEFPILNNLPFDGLQVLSIWKNMLLVIGNINQIKGSQNYALAMTSVLEIWDTLRLVRARQNYNDANIPAMYEIVPWLFQAAELPPTYNVGKAAAFGGLCRLMIQKPEEKIPDGYFTAFYSVIFKGLKSEDNMIVQSIITNSEQLFGSSLPGVHILIPSFMDAIEKQLLKENQPCDVPSNVRKSCITILGSLVSIANHLKDIAIQTEGLNIPYVDKIQQNKQFSFSDVKIWLKDILIRLVNVGVSVRQIKENTDTHCMVLGAICTLVLDELLSSNRPQFDIIHECISSLVKHLYWCNISIINNVVDCFNTLAQTYKEELDTDSIIIREILSSVIDAIGLHLKYYERDPKCGRGYIISKLFGCLLEWAMSIEPTILIETDLSELIFDVIEFAIYISTDKNGKLLPRTPKISQNKKNKLSFKLESTSEKNPEIQHELIENITSSEIPENDQGYVKESAEAVLLHLLNQFNSFPPPYGPATMHTTVIGPGLGQDDQQYQHYQYFSFNDTTIIAFAELNKENENDAHARVIIRDLTGRYAWDTKLEPKIDQNQSKQNKAVRMDQFNFRENISIASSNEKLNKIDEQSILSKPENKDPMGSLLKRIGELHPDCLLNPGLPLNEPNALTSLQMDMVGDLGVRLNEYLLDESQNNKQQETDIDLWYSKIKMLREKEFEKNQTKRGESTMQIQLATNFSSNKDFLPAFPQEAEVTHVPFQESRLLLSHMGFIGYQQLKDGLFQMLNKTPTLYRDLRGLDRKHGREIMKIGLIYVAHGQEDETTILKNNQGSDKYNAFVNSLGWEIDIATHTGYLGGLERNMTNGSTTTYYCSSTLEMIFHDVTKMPTDPSDPKQLKKKRHIGNDHVHIVWNEHDRDYKFDTIGGDFGNAQIIVTPLPDNLYSIQVYRDLKIPYFGPLFDRMIVSQAILGPLVRSTAITAFRASVHTNLYSFYKCVYAHRDNDVRTIINRHKIANWSYDQFMEKIFMTEER